MRPNLRQLEIFQLFSRVLSVTETARILRVTQPSISQALRDLETFIGVPLLLRGKTGLRITPAGYALLKDIENVLDGLDVLANSAARLRGEEDSKLRIATILPICGSIVPNALRNLQSVAPETHVAVETYSSREVIRKIEDHSADIGLTFLPIDAPDLIQHMLMTTEMACLLPPDHPLTSKRVITGEDLREEIIINLGTQVRQEFDARVIFDRPLDDPRYMTTNLATLSVDLVQKGVGVAISLPYVIQGKSEAEVVLRPFSPAIRRSLVAIFPAQPALSSVGRKFLNFVHAELAEFAKELEAMGVKSRVPAH